MLDHLRLSIPVFKIYAVERGTGHFYFEGDLLSLGLSCASRIVKYNDEGSVVAHDLYAPYDKLGTDFSDMAIKFYDKGINCLPYLELKASPLKLLQGHNVYGFESIELGAIEMLGLITEALPELCKYLDFANTQVLHIDTTYMATLPHQNLVPKVLEYLSNVSSGHAKSQNLRYQNYVRWGVQNSRYIGRKVYGKYEEVENQIKQLKKQAGTDSQALNKLNAIVSAKDFAKSKLRFEARICKTYLTKNGYPSNLFELIALQHKQPKLLQEFWQIAFSPIFKALEGENMMLSDDDTVLELLKSKLFTITKKGNVSYTKAFKAYQFYKTVKSDGYENVRSKIAKSTFYDNVSLLLSCGISKSHLQNMHNEKLDVIPFVRLVQIDFGKQVPDDYVVPASKYQLPLVA
ncbi:phage/plasmid replication protein, II/X family [Moraxella marmotae]|uniref:phage/plasmid replication protein, II/X family n=1 Tax=Moraxella marmotae TaxID=3344520 RepID=UPI0035F34F40